jgi:transposase
MQCNAKVPVDMSTAHRSRQVVDIPEPKVVVTEHRAHGCACPKCLTVTWAAFPDDVKAPVQYGARICAFVVYLLNYQLLPEDRLAQLLSDLFGLKMVPATIARMSAACARRLQSFADNVRERVTAARVKHLDETGFRIGGRTQWLHIFSTALLTFYRVASKRGSLLSGVTGIVVHDHWKPYYAMKGVLHALCNAHHLRELKALVEIEKEEWAAARAGSSRCGIWSTVTVGALDGRAPRANQPGSIEAAPICRPTRALHSLERG